MSAAFREGWERIFGPKPPKKIIRNPFTFRHGSVTIHYEIPEDFNIEDLRRLVRHLGTMCDDWEPDMGFAEIVFRNHNNPINDKI